MKRLIVFIIFLGVWELSTSQMFFTTKSFDILGEVSTDSTVFIQTSNVNNGENVLIHNRIRNQVINNEISVSPETLDSIDQLLEMVVSDFSADMLANNHILSSAPKIKMSVEVLDDFDYDYEVSRVEIQYVVGESMNNPYINTGGIDRSLFLKPTALAKYYSLTDILANQTNPYDIKVYLNGNILNGSVWSGNVRYNLDYSRNATENEYDLATILFRALVAGCGFHSELHQDNEGYLSVWTNINGQDYISLFDSGIENAAHNKFPNPFDTGELESEIQHNIISSVLNNNTINFVYALYNDYNASINYLNPEVANFLDFDISNENELMQSFFATNISIHELTPKTSDILSYLGWRFDFPVGPTYETKSITMADTLYENVTYTVQLQNCAVGGDFMLKLQASDGEFILHKEEVSILGYQPSFSFSLDTIPNLLWLRDLSSGTAKAIASYTDNDGTIEKEVYIPIKPSVPIVMLDTISSGSNLFDATLHFSAQGAKWYVIAYHDIDLNEYHYDTLTNVNTHTFNYLPKGHSYEFHIEAFNSAGSESKLEFLLNESPSNSWSLLAWTVGTDKLRFSVAFNSMQIDYPVLKSEIYSTSGLLLITQNSSTKQINISSLSRGVYVIKVTLQNNIVLTSMFAKR